MKDKLKNKKGVTLLEIIVSMSIMTTIMFISYKVINGINKVRSDQQIITSEQQPANIIRKYLSKDLERCKSVELKDSKNGYMYEIKMVDDSIVVYEVSISSNTYSVNRIESDDTIELIYNQRLKENHEKPFSISQKNNLYVGSIVCNEVEKDKYVFEIASKIDDAKYIEGAANNNIIITAEKIYNGFREIIRPQVGDIQFEQSKDSGDFNDIIITVDFIDNKLTLEEREFSIDGIKHDIAEYDSVFNGEYRDYSKVLVNATDNENFLVKEFNAYDEKGNLAYTKDSNKDDIVNIDLGVLGVEKRIGKLELYVNVENMVSIEFSK